MLRISSLISAVLSLKPNISFILSKVNFKSNIDLLSFCLMDVFIFFTSESKAVKPLATLKSLASASIKLS